MGSPFTLMSSGRRKTQVQATFVVGSVEMARLLCVGATDERDYGFRGPMPSGSGEPTVFDRATLLRAVRKVLVARGRCAMDESWHFDQFFDREYRWNLAHWAVGEIVRCYPELDDDALRGFPDEAAQ